MPLGRGTLVAILVLSALVLAGPALGSYTAKIAGGTLTLTGNSAGDKLLLRLKPGAPGRLQVDVGANGSVDFEFARSKFTKIVVNAGGGNDAVTISGGFTAQEQTTLNGGSGKDKLTGGTGPETFSGGPGTDVLAGKGGADLFRWKPGDGSDKVDGQAGNDALNVHGASGVDQFNVTPNGARTRISHPGALIDAGTTESLELAPQGGADSVSIADLGASATQEVTVDLGVGTADGAADAVTVQGTSEPDALQVDAVGTQVQVTGASEFVELTHSEPADTLTVAALEDDDMVSAGGSLAALIRLVLSGGAGDDTLIGGTGNDVIDGGSGFDSLDGNEGADTVLGGADDDDATWNPGDGNDTLDGGSGDDALVFNGAGAAEVFTASAVGGNLQLIRDVGGVVMTATQLEELSLFAAGGADTLTVNDLSTTAVRRVSASLGVDVVADAVTFNGSSGVDVMSIAGGSGTVTLTSPALTLALTDAAPANDTLAVNLLAGADLVSASSLAGTSVLLTLNGGSDDDVLIGSDGNDVFDGGPGTDYVDGRAGIDVATNAETVVNVP